MQRASFIKRPAWWLILITLAILVKIWSLFPAAIENYYSNGIYLPIAKVQRIVFGWLPFSFGDLIYLGLSGWLSVVTARNMYFLFSRKHTFSLFRRRFIRLVFITLIFYVFANLAWGLNYDRETVAQSMDLPTVSFDSSALLQIENLLIKKVNESKIALLKKGVHRPPNPKIYERAAACYRTSGVLPELDSYRPSSIKSSLFGRLGNYLGFTGYFNPLTGEAQVNKTVPWFLLPFISSHEIAHQLGYAKENEANFVGYLASVNSADTLFHYSAYLDLFAYTHRQLFLYDSVLARTAAAALHPAVKEDIEEWRRFNLAHTSALEPVITWIYNKYLQANRQPQGIKTYGEVTALLISYYKKYGKL